MFSCEGIGRTIENAVENALLELKASRDDVDIKVLNPGGLFKKAKVLVTISDDAKEKYQKRFETREEEKKEALKEEKKEEKLVEKQEKKEEKETIKEEKKASKIEEKEDDQEKEETAPCQNIEEDKKVVKHVDALEFLQGFFKTAGKDVEIKTSADDKYITYSVEGEDLGDLIGYRGECFYAISRLVSAICGKGEKRILLDIGGYRAKRAESLTQLAHRMAGKVIKSGKYVKLDPMNPGDRRIIHTALQDEEKVTTLSKGVEPHRYVMIFPKEYDER